MLYQQLIFVKETYQKGINSTQTELKCLERYIKIVFHSQAFVWTPKYSILFNKHPMCDSTERDRHDLVVAILQ